MKIFLVTIERKKKTETSIINHVVFIITVFQNITINISIKNMYTFQNIRFENIIITGMYFSIQNISSQFISQYLLITGMLYKMQNNKFLIKLTTRKNDI